MPELPEVETVRRGLAPALEGRIIVRARLFRKDLRFPFPAGLVQRVSGQRVHSVERRAKFLLIRLEGGDVLISHLGMSGRYRIHSDAAPAREPHDHFELETDAGCVIRYFDPRRFGILDICSADELAEQRFLKGLGPEPLGNAFDGRMLEAGLAGRRTPVKVALLDQRIVAGIGNIYASEALYRAGISPKRMAKTVLGGRADRLAAAIREVLMDAIAAGGSTLRDHRQATGELGYFQHRFRVYGRDGEKCSDCDCRNTILCIRQAGRATFYCAKRQR